MRQLLIISFFIFQTSVSFSQGNKEKFADPAYYLLDSLQLSEMHPVDKQIIDSCLKVYHAAKTDTTRLKAINFITNQCNDMEVWTRYNDWMHDRAVELLKKKWDKKTKNILLSHQASGLSNKGYAYEMRGQIEMALKMYDQAIPIQKSIGDKDGEANCYNNMGLIYMRLGDVPLALKYFQTSIDICEKIGDEASVASTLSNIASLYNEQGDYEKALDYHNKSLELKIKTGKHYAISTSYNNIAMVYNNMGDYAKAKEFLLKSCDLNAKVGDFEGEATSLFNLGGICFDNGDFSGALKYFEKALKIKEEVDDPEGMAHCLSGIGQVYLRQGNFGKALEYGIKAFDLSEKLGFPRNIEKSASILAQVYEKQNKGMEALKMYKLEIKMRDSINDINAHRAALQQNIKYSYHKQAISDSIKNAEKQKVTDAQIAEQKAINEKSEIELENKRIQQYALFGGIALLVIFSAFVYNRFRVTNQQKIIIEEQKHIVDETNHVLEERNREILDSINYAQRIQKAILPPSRIVKEYLKESFILYEPKDIVAGDFYWMETLTADGFPEGTILFAAADCTGHGVPGAMVSVVCHNCLNRSVRQHGLTRPGEILDKTRELVISEFEKSDDDVKDGMDISLCALNLQAKTLLWAGANNPLWILRKGEVMEIKADKQPIGKYAASKPFTNHEVPLEMGDSIYIFTDGYQDQFGGPTADSAGTGKKFKATRLRDLIKEIGHLPMEDQKNRLRESIHSWKGNLEQVDDICIIGVRI